MTYCVTIGDAEAAPLATCTGLHDFGDWVDSLPVEQFPELVHFHEHGWEQDLPELTEQLQQALADYPPGSESAASTAEQLLSRLHSRDPDAEMVSINNGMEPDDGVDENDSAPMDSLLSEDHPNGI